MRDIDRREKLHDILELLNIDLLRTGATGDFSAAERHRLNATVYFLHRLGWRWGYRFGWYATFGRYSPELISDVWDIVEGRAVLPILGDDDAPPEGLTPRDRDVVAMLVTVLNRHPGPEWPRALVFIDSRTVFFTGVPEAWVWWWRQPDADPWRPWASEAHHVLQLWGLWPDAFPPDAMGSSANGRSLGD